MLLMTLLAPWAANAQQSAPYNEGFEAMSDVTDLNTAGWEMLYQSHSGSFLAIETGASNVFAGSKALNIDSWNAGSSSDWVIVGLPTISNKAVNELQMTFSYKVSTGNVYIGYLTDPDDYSTFVTVESFNSSSSYSTKTVEFGGVPATATRIAIKYLNYYRCYVDEVEVKQLPNCKTPQNLTPSNLKTDRVTLTWERNAAGTEDAWILEYGTTSDFTGATTVSVTGGNPTKTLTGLTENTKYYARVKADCGGEESDPTAAISFTTLCEPTTIPTAGWSENFDSYTHTSNTTTTNNLPDCWSYINTTTYSTYQGYPYVYYGSSYSSSGNYHLRLYSYYSSWSNYDPQPQYAILPPMDNLTGKQITLKARGYNTSGTFKIGTMTDPSDPSTFVAITEQTGLTTSYQEFTYPLSGTNVCVVIMIDAANSSRSTNGVYIDDIVINDAPNCVKPIGLDLEATGQTATFTWTSDASQWQVAYSKDASADPDDNIVGLVDVKSFTKDNLELDADHYFWVRTYCGTSEQSDWAGPVSVHIGYCVPAPTSVDNNGISNVTFGTGAYVVNNDTPKATYADYTSQIGAVQVGVETSIAITFATGYTYNTFVWVDLDNSLSFESNEVICYGESTGTNPTTLTLNFTIPTNQTLGDFRLRIGSADSGLGSNPTAANPCYTGSYGCFQDYTLRVLEAPSCMPPTGLTVNYTGGDEATVSWTSEATAWNIDVNGTVTPITENPYTLTGLNLATTYEVKVQTDCGSNGTSDWTSAVSFTTDLCLPADMCEISYSLTDQYNDSWNGASINVVDVVTGSLIASITMPDGDGPYTGSFSVCNGREIRFDWVKGNYPSECGFVLTDINGEEILNCAIGSAPTSNTTILASYTVDCTVTNCKTPTALAASEIGNHSVKLNWTENGEASSWKVAYTLFGETKFTEVDANAKPFTLTGLDPATHYTVKVRPICSDFDNKWSDEIDFTTDVACPAPTALTAVPTPFDAEISWTGSASAYTLEYAEYPISSASEWLQYDNGTVQTNVGNSTIYTWTWGVMYPASMLNGNNTLTKVAFYETSYYSDGDPITIEIYSGGDAEPQTLMATKNVTCLGVVGVHEVQLDPVSIDPSQNLWIVLTSTTIDRPMAMSNVDEANGRWVNNGGWMDIGSALSSVATYTFMIRGFVETLDMSSMTWTTVSNVTSPYTITGLDPETKYAVRVKADCGGDGESAWTMTTFTTPSNCAAPSALDVTSILPTEATLNWTGYQGSFNIQYRTSATWDLSYSEGFESGIPSTWTTIDSDGDGYNWITLDEVSTTYPSGNYGNLSGWAHTGSNAATSASYVNYVGSFDANNWLISPQLELKDYLRFFVTSTYSDPDSYEVLLSTTGTATTDFTTTLKAMGEATYNSWDEVIIDLSSYSGKGYIAIHHVSSDKYFLVVDDFGIGVPVAEGAWVDATATTTTLNITGLTPETDYDWQVQGVNSKCTGGVTDWSSMGHFTTLPDEPIAILNNGLWNAPTTWDDGTVPPANSSVIINGDVIVPTGYTAVADEITIVNGSITIQEGGQLQHSNEIPVTFNMVVEPYTAKSGANGYRLIATPVYTTSSYSIPVTATGLATGTFDLYSFDQSKQLEWRNYEASAFTDLDMGYGYLYANAGSVSPTFSGNTIPTSPLTFTDLPLATAADGLEFVGWHLLGNPFTCNCYITNGTSGIAFYKMKAGGSELEAVAAGTSVAPMEGFFVQVTSATNTTGFQITAPAKSGSSLGITLNQGTTKVDNAFISFSNGQTLEKIQLDPNHSKVYMPVDGKDYAVASAGNQGEMPINFKAETNGTYTLNFSSEDTNFSYLHLIDNKNGNDVDLLATPSYTFDARYTDYASRFKLVFATSDTSDDQFAFISNGEIILSGVNGNTTVQLFDVTGRMISSTNGANRISTENMAAGVYMLRLVNGSDVKTQKIVVK
ncbi:MAG: fibronectin type III domain-containing protein [Bacteroidales bacterium]|nr:fibronectin type III domain-containing protein [Bacteroidales bacterium]